jgi:hypothetical protein
VSPRRKRPYSPFESGYRSYSGTLDHEVTVAEVRAALPSWTELWDGRDGTKAVSVKKVLGQEAWQVRIIAKGGKFLPVPTLFPEAHP